MASTNKPKTPSSNKPTETKQQAALSAKQAAKAKQAALQQQRQRQQQILLGVIAAVLVIVVIGVIFFTTRPPEANIPVEAKTTYADFADASLHGVTSDGYPYIGKADAPHVMEEFASFSCPVCLAYHDQIFTSILDEFKAGRAKLVYIPVTTTGDFPPEVVTEAGYCALQQDKFWEFQEILYDWQSRYGTNSNDTARLGLAAQSLGMDVGKFNSCLGSKPITDQVAKGNQFSVDRHMTGTPTVYLDGKLLQPLPQGQNSPNLIQLRGLLEVPVTPAATAAATTSAAPSVATAAATTAK